MKKIIAAILAGTVMLSGCVKVSTETENSGKADTLRYWAPLSPNVSVTYSSLNDTEFAKNLIKKTGINVVYEHPVIGQEQEKFSLMMASSDLPDIVDYYWGGAYPGGPSKAIENKKIYKLNDIIDKNSPNIKKYFEENPKIEKAVSTIDGDIYGYPMTRGGDILCTFYGGMIRKDLLEKAGLEVPETISEWETVLTAFKDMGIKYPLSYSLSIGNLNIAPIFMCAYNVANSFYMDGDTIKFGPLEPGYKEYLTLMNKWYQNGLLDKDFPSNDTDAKRLPSLVINSETAATFGYAGSAHGKYIEGLKAKDPSYKLTPVRYPVLNKGDKVEFAQRSALADESGTSAAITTACKNVELAAKFLDYGYGKEGQIFYNFGIEGDTYTEKDGHYVYTDKIMDTSKNGGLPVSQAIAKYAQASYGGPFIQHPDYILQSYSNQEQKDALTLWADNGMEKHLVPPMVLPSDDMSKISRIVTDANTYIQETTYKMIMEKDGMNRYDEFIKNLKDIGIEEIIKMKQDVYDRIYK